MHLLKPHMLQAARMALLAVAVVVATGAAALAQTSANEQDSLRAAALLFRHSVISPKYTPPKVDTEWPMGFKQLTAIGMRDMYRRGQQLRRKYVDELGLISGTYHADEVYVRASNTDRALQSAQMLILGLFPLGTGPDPSIYDSGLSAAPAPELAFTAVPIHSVALENDSVLRPWTGKAECTKYRKYVKGLSKTALYRDQGQKYEDFLRRMSAITGVGEGKKLAKILYEVNEIYEPLSANVQHNLALPAGISDEDMDLTQPDALRRDAAPGGAGGRLGQYAGLGARHGPCVDRKARGILPGRPQHLGSPQAGSAHIRRSFPGVLAQARQPQHHYGPALVGRTTAVPQTPSRNRPG